MRFFPSKAICDISFEKMFLNRPVLYFCFTLLVLTSNGAADDEPWIHYLHPRSGSLNGGTRVTIFGRGFSKNQFNFGDGNAHLGNTVTMVSDLLSFPCDVHKDGSTEKQIQCYTRAMPREYYYIRVTVDGQEVPNCDKNHCRFRGEDYYTPKIYKLIPFSAEPYELVTMEGFIYTDLYGSNVAEASNGKTQQLLRAYVGGNKCEVRKDTGNTTDELFGFAITKWTHYGVLTCRNEGSYVGHSNTSFIISDYYGRSLPKAEAMRISSTNKLHMLQTYAVVSDVSPSTGSTVGGTRLVITGKYFDESEQKVKVYVGGTPCNIIGQISTTQIVCETEAEPANKDDTDWPGSRGITLSLWENVNVAHSAYVATLETYEADGTAPSLSYRLDSLWYDENKRDRFVMRFEGYFVAPETTEYMFYVNVDDSATLYLTKNGTNPAHKEIIASSSYTNNYYQNSGQVSSRIPLTKSQSYYMLVLYREATSVERLKVAVKMFKASYIPSQTSSAFTEKQTISLTSNVVSEVQKLSFGSWTSASVTKEKQTVAVTSSTNSGSFKLGFYGVYTEEITFGSTSSVVATALNKLVSLTPDTVSVSKSGTTYTVTFNTNTGDVPNLTFKENGVSIVVAETVKGVASLSEYRFQYENVISPVISHDSTATQVEDAVMSMFSVKCPPELYPSVSGSVAYREDYEGSFPSSFGSQSKDVEPFCGFASAKNPTYIFYVSNTNEYLSLSTFRQVCFAYKGTFLQKIRLRYYYYHNKQFIHRNTDFTITLTKDNLWHYNCVDMKTLVLGSGGAPSGSAYHKLVYARLWRDSTVDEDVFVDQVVISSSVTTSTPNDINERRLGPASLLMHSVSVVKDSSSPIYNVTMLAHGCNNNFKLIGLAGLVVGSGSVDSNAVTYKPASGSQTMNNDRQAAASPPPGGVAGIKLPGQTPVDVLPAATDRQMKDALETIADLGSVSVTRSGLCHNYVWTVEWLTPGNKDALLVDTSGLTGSGVNMTVATARDAHIFFDPIPGDMLRTYHAKPQVEVYINGIPSSCNTNNASDCPFEWKNASTPTITAVSPSSGSALDLTNITITGTGFDVSNCSTNNVTIGNTGCSVISCTATQIVCAVGKGPVGAYDIILNVQSKGLALHPVSGHIQFTYDWKITSLTPIKGSQGGGTLITIIGTGFAPSATLTVGDVNCEILTRSYSSLTCRTPSGTGEVIVSLQQNSNSINSPSNFTYDANITAIVTSISTTSAMVKGGTFLQITGTSFGSSGTDVKVNGVAATILSWSATEINVTLPATKGGSYALEISVGDAGYAELSSNNIGDIVYALNVTGIYPDSGSLYGGTCVQVSGVGFDDSNCTNNVIKFGTIDCMVTACNSTSITCTIQGTTRTHTVGNGGIHPTYGIGYEWQPKSLSIARGETVRFWWAAPLKVDEIKYKVQETSTPSASAPKPDGFDSGPKTGSGSYEQTFTSIGNHYYWSSYVDQGENIIMRGVVRVEERQPWSAPMTLFVGGAEAEYDVSGSSSSGDCSGADSDISGCSQNATSCSDNSRFCFSFNLCRSPKINSISPRMGTTNDDIVIQGNGFSSAIADNVVKFGNYSCIVSSANETQIVCRIDTAQAMSVGTMYPITLTVENLGTALLPETGSTAARSFVLTPHVDSVSPTNGSMAGGTILTITGDGFTGTTADTVVEIGAYQCVVTSVSYTSITCKTSLNSVEGSNAVVVKVRTPSTSQIATNCSTPGGCQFDYTSTMTPVITSVSPTTISGANTVVNFVGTGFGTNSAKITINIGDVACNVDSITDTAIACNVSYVPVGSRSYTMYRDNHGNAKINGASTTITSDKVIDSISPMDGSRQGGTELTITGSGFVADSTTVNVHTKTCIVQSVTLSQVVCITPAYSASTKLVVVTSNGITYPGVDFIYSVEQTPTVTAINPVEGTTGDDVTITGTGFNDTTSNNRVMIGDAECNVTSSNDTVIECTLMSHRAGSVDVNVHVKGKGNATSTTTFKYLLQVSSTTPPSGSFGGGQEMTLSGKGFEADMTVTVCGNPCTLTSVTPTQAKCDIPLNGGIAQTTVTCDAVVMVGAETVTKSSAYQYKSSETPMITSINKARGGTGGGTTLVITGTSFGNTSIVTIAGTLCNVSHSNATTIVCMTGAHRPSELTKVRVKVDTFGIAAEQTLGVSDFYYIDVWSSPYTWGGSSPPTNGDFVIVPKNQTLLLDTDTAIIKMLLIQGGKLIFDEKDVKLDAERILITDGGLLQVGTRENPFQHKAIITLHGHLRSEELPIYGTKVLAIREGTLDLHGIPKHITWTELESTANAGATTITLKAAVDWEVGDEIVIATTGLRHSQKESEKRTIKSISVNKKTLTLTSALTYEHLGVTYTLPDGTQVDFRAEVGLLTHNVVVRGSRDAQWSDEIEACPDGFDTGEFATQTCFQGRFGEEMGSDQFGAQIIMHAPEKGTTSSALAVGHIEYVEVTYAGQAFRLGRYPIHFHLNGNMTGSYVRGCGIHETFNRAVNIHGTNNVLVEHTVIYNIMGGSFFLEDGIEMNNIFQYNLAVFVKSSTSLLNDDITPAAFWITNPNNIVQHNHAAGGTHFGFWYRMHAKPDGPSKSDPTYGNICPQGVPLGVFHNNTGHSLGWFAIWIFEDYAPKDSWDGCSGAAKPAVYRQLTAWHCEKGAEWVNGGAIQFDGFVMVENELAGIEMKKNIHGKLFDADGPLINNSVIAGWASPQRHCTVRGIVLPLSPGLLIVNTKFLNFNESGCVSFGVTAIQGTCITSCGGWEYRFRDISYINSPNKATFKHEHEAIFHDLDGSLTVGGASNAGYKVTPTNPTLPPSSCSSAAEWSKAFPGSICTSGVEFIRLGLNNEKPSSLSFKNLLLTNPYGTSSIPYLHKRLTHKPGYMATLVSKGTYNMIFENADHITNISYTAAYYGLSLTDYVIIKHNLTQRPDRFRIKSGSPDVNEPQTLSLNYDDNVWGDYFFNDNNKELTYMVSGKTSNSQRKKRGINVGPEAGHLNRFVDFKVYRCFYEDCIPPPDPNTIPPARERPANAKFWSNAATWVGGESGQVVSSRRKRAVYEQPANGANVTIAGGDWIVVDVENLPWMDDLIIYGVLELENGKKSDGSYYNIVLNCTYISILGGRLIVGWPDNPFLGTVQIALRGHHHTPDKPLPNGPNMGSKVIGVFGGLDIHGKDRGIAWTRLASTANVGANSITLKKAVEWEANDEIMITTSSINAWQTETFKVLSISADMKTLTLNATLQYKHQAVTETLGGKAVTMSAEVALLTRNIKIIGQDYAKLFEESFGARILVSKFAMMINSEIKEFIGYARITNVEFYHSGQEGYRDEFDPRYSLAFLNSGTVDTIRPSYVRKNAFHHGFSPAIGVFGASGVVVDDNVVHHCVGEGIRVFGTNNTVRRNLVSITIWPGSYQNRFEINWIFEASIDISKSVNAIVQGNVVAGSEKIGYRLPKLDCTNYNPEKFKDNTVHGALTGIFLDIRECTGGCSMITGFTIWKTWHYGIYANSMCSFKVEDTIMADNRVGLFPMVVGPASSGHAFENKFVEVRNTIIAGMTSGFDCAVDFMAANDKIILGVSQAKFHTENGVGLVWPAFVSGHNEALRKPWASSMSYNALRGLMTVTNVTFSKFGAGCGSKRNYAFMDNVNVQDLLHPIRSSNLILESVDEDSKVFVHRSVLGKINPSDCVDMACDAQNKVLLDDLDGTLLQGPGSCISQSEYYWKEISTAPANKVNTAGLGDFRIPQTLLTAPNGTRLSITNVAPHKGIIRSGRCAYKPLWQAYECHDLDYEMMAIESMDADTEMRRLSPVAILGDQYIDLINGPQDHGWCAGYTCQERLSTFHALVAMGKLFKVYFTGTSPQHLRLHLLNAADNQAVLIAINYKIPQRLDVYLENGVYIYAINSQLNQNGDVTLKPESYKGEWIPPMDSFHGNNYFDREMKELYVLVRGSTYLDIKLKPVVILKLTLPPINLDDFFKVNLINNLAAFLKIPANKIKIVNVVSENSGRRRKRATSGTQVEIEISNSPTNSSSHDNSTDLSYDAMANITSQVVTAVQNGTFGQQLNVTILDVGLVEPVPPDTTNPAWQQMTDSDNAAEVTIQIPAKMTLHTDIVALHEGEVFSTQPAFQVFDKNDNIVEQLGTKANPWKLTASVRAGSGTDSNAKLLGTTTINFLNGWANFTDLAISHSGSGYIVDYAVTYPAGSSYTAATTGISIPERPLVLKLVLGVNETQVSEVTVGEEFSLQTEIQDSKTGNALTDIFWKGHTWMVTAIVHIGDVTSLAGVASIQANSSSIRFDNLSLSHSLPYPQRYMIKLTAVSSPAKYDLPVLQMITVWPSLYEKPVTAVNKTVRLKFNSDFSAVENKTEQFEAVLWNHFMTKYWNNSFDFNITKGSIIVTFIVGGSASDVNTTLIGIWQDVKSGLSLTFNGQVHTASAEMKVEGQDYYGLDTPTEKGKEPFPVGAIIGIAIVGVLLLAAVIIIVVWKMCLTGKKTSTRISPSPDPDDESYGRSEKRLGHYTVHGEGPIQSKPPVQTRWTDAIPDPAVYSVQSINPVDQSKSTDDRSISPVGQ